MGLFSSSASLHSKNGLSEDHEDMQKSGESTQASSHRFFLKKKNSRNSLSPQTSPSSIGSFLRKKNNSNHSPSNHSPFNHSPSTFSLFSHGQEAVHRHSAPSPHMHTDTMLTEAIPDSDGSSTAHASIGSSDGHAEHNRAHFDLHSINDSLPPTPSSKGLPILLPQEHKDSTKLSKKDKSKSESHHHHHLSLRRFLKKLKHTDSHSSHKSDASSIYSSKQSAGKPDILPSNSSSELFKKYGGVGRLLGTGASGSVNLVTSHDDSSQIFAVKKFRAKLPSENESDYKVRVKNEFKIGEYLSHDNLIHTMELIKDYPTDKPTNLSHHSITKNKASKLLQDPVYYIVMEYCPFDFFNLVMSGLMDTNEIFCYFKQIVDGVSFLHENGLAHRDLKLDNCVVNDHGILKLIDFGSAVQFRKEINASAPLNATVDEIIDEKYKLVRARGIVGSDPYLAPEVFEPSNFGYDPRAADVWSIATIYCCMILKRFPWKIPKISEPSYRSFIGIPEESKDSTPEDPKKPPRGPDRLLRLLPKDSRELLRSMLIIDPKKRFLMPDIVKDEFYLSIEKCKTKTDEKGKMYVEKPDNHIHHLITEEELQKLNQEKEKLKKLKDAGIA